MVTNERLIGNDSLKKERKKKLRKSLLVVRCVSNLIPKTHSSVKLFVPMK